MAAVGRQFLQAVIEARVAISDTWGASHALARFSADEAIVVAFGGARAAVERLPIAALRLPAYILARQEHDSPAALYARILVKSSSDRGVAVVLPDVPDSERLHQGGVRGLRFSLWRPSDSVTSIDMVEPLAKRVANLGWHVQLHMSGDQIVANGNMLRWPPCSIVFDHMGRLPPAKGPDHPAFRVIAERVDAGQAWLKLSGGYLDTASGPPDYADATRTAKAYVRLAPERVVWGSDWPHLTETHKPDDADLFDLAPVWAGDDATFVMLMAGNAERL